MDGLLNIVSTATTLNNKQFLKLLNGFDNHQAFSQRASSELDSIVSLITNCLNSQDQKYEGLLLLKNFISQCQLDIIEQKGNLWISLCTKVCIQKKPAAAVCLSYDVIIDLLEKSIHIPELGKSIASNLLSKIIESVNGLSGESHLAALKCIETCMKLYPGPCGSSRTIIDRFLATFVDDTDRTLVRQSGKCLHLLQQVRGGGSQGLSQKNAWALLQTQLIGSLHSILDQIYANTAETYDGNSYATDAELLKVPELLLNAEPVARATQLVTRFQNLSEYFRVILTEPFPVPKLIQPGKVISLISRGLAVNCSTLSKNLITDNVAIGALLPQIHVSLLNILDSLILLLGTNLLPYANNICQLIIQSLRWTSSGKAVGFKRPYSAIRQSAYRTLTIWCKITKSGSLIESIADDLIKFILKDITPFQSEVTLKVLSGSRKYLSKKARQRLNKAQNDASNIAQTHSKAFNPHNTKIIYSDNGNESICGAALYCLSQTILAVGCFLKPVYQKILQENVVSIALKIAGSVPKKSNLYFSDECRAGLYSALNALVMGPHHFCPPPLQYAATVFSIVQVHDTNAKIRERCSDYLRCVEKILHPQKEVFYFPTDVNEVVDALKIGNDKKQFDNEQSESSEDEEDLDIDMTTETTTLIKTKTIISQALAAEKEQSSLNRQSETFEAKTPSYCSVQLTDIIREASPPRKSSRLNSLSTSVTPNVENDSPVRQDSPSPRRKSARLSSISIQETPQKLDELLAPKQILLVDEPKPSKSNEVVSNVELTKDNSTTQNVDDLVNEMVSAFVDEFIDDEDESTE